LNILFIHNRYQYRGGEDTTLLMEKEILEAHGHQTRTLEFDNDNIGSVLSKIKTGIGAFYNVASANRVTREIARFRPDVIHIHNLFFNASPAVLFSARKMNIPVVMTVQNFRLVCANALLLRDNQVCELCIQKRFPLHGIKYKCYRSSAIESALVVAVTGIHKSLHTWQKKINRIIVPSHFMKDKLAASSLKPASGQLVVKANFVGDNFSGNTGREDFYLFVGRLSKEKGIHVLLQPFLQETGLRLVIAGDGPEKEYVLDAIKNAPGISYVGLQDKKAVLQLMQKCKALLFPSIWYEGQPLSILEAFSTGTPVIASRLGVMTELIEDGINGYHFAAGDAADLKRCIGQFEQNITGRQAFYENARQSYLTRYSPGIHYDAVINIYNEAIAAARHE
jgi:glycosyltransferase involved in cell wall biosynthesis